MTQEFVCESCMRGHHICKDVPDPMRPEVFTCVQEAGNDANPYSVAMMNCSMTVVGHESMAEEGTLEDSATCGHQTADSHLYYTQNSYSLVPFSIPILELFI